MSGRRGGFVTFKWTGLKELRSELRSLAAMLAEDAAPLVQYAAESAEQEMAAGYARHRRSGRLAAGLTRTKRRLEGPAVGWRVRNTAYHVQPFEHGTHFGSTPGNVFIPIRRQHQQALYELLKKRLEAFNFRVTGNAVD